MQRHVIVGAIAAVAIMAWAPSADTVTELAFIPILVGVVVRSAARGADAKFGHIWGWLYPEPTSSTRLDRLAERLVVVLTPQPLPEPPTPKVRPLEPFDRRGR